MRDLQYNAIVHSLLCTLPEIRINYDALQAEIGPGVLPYMVISLALEPFVANALKVKADDSLLQRTFAFLEEMARSKDIEVVNLLYVGFFENWLGEPETLINAWQYMGDRTKAVARDAARRLNRVHNLPHGK